MESPSLYIQRSLGVEPLDLPAHEYGISSSGLSPMCYMPTTRVDATQIFGSVHEVPRDPVTGSTPDQAKGYKTIFPLPMSLPPHEICNTRSGYHWETFALGNPDLAKQMGNGISEENYNKLSTYMRDEHEKIFQCDFNALKGLSINGGANHTNGPMMSFLELATEHYTRSHVDIKPGQPIIQAWEAMQPLVKIATQLFSIIDSTIVKSLIEVFDNDTKKDILLQMEKIEGTKALSIAFRASAGGQLSHRYKI